MNKRTKRILSILLVAVMLLGMIPVGMLPVAAADSTYAGDETVKADITWYTNNESATEYEISTSAQLLGFASIMNEKVVNGANVNFSGKTIKLTADIDLNPNWDASTMTAPTNLWINKNGSNFAGTFDGQGHTVSGLYFKTTNTNNAGMFVGGDGGTVKNFALLNSYFEQAGGSSYHRVAAIFPCVTNSENTSTIENVYTDAIVVNSGSNSGAGGIFGSVNQTKPSAVIKNCVFAGKVTSKSKNVGGILGEIVNDNTGSVTITNCVNMGTVQGTENVGGIIGRDGGSSPTTVTSCINLGKIHYNNNDCGDIVGYGRKTTLKITSTYHINGLGLEEKTAYNGNVSDDSSSAYVSLADLSTTLNNDSAFYQGWTAVDKCTVLLPEYIMTEFSEYATPKAQAVKQQTVIDPSWYISPDSSWEENTYYLSDAADLLGFASIMNEGIIGGANVNFSGKTIKLTADIDLNPNWDASTMTAPTNLWINKNGSNFAGTFDGQGHTVSGLYLKASTNNVGMFVGLNSGTIKDFALLNSYFEQTSGDRVAAICPTVANNSSQKNLIENVYTDAIVVNSGSKNGAGGIVGVLPYSFTSFDIKGCVFAGTVIAKGVKYVGGIVGNGNDKAVNITDCVNMGTVIANDEVGGIIGRNGTVDMTITNCVNLGTVKCTANNAFDGDIVGKHKLVSTTTDGVTTTNKLTLTDCYWVDGAGSGRAYGTGADCVAATEGSTYTRVALTTLGNIAIDGWSAVGTGSLKLPAYIVTNFADDYKAAVNDLLGYFPTGLTVDANNADYSGSHYSKMYYYSGVSETAYNNYISTLTSGGYKSVQTYEADGCYYKLLQNDSKTLYVSFLRSASGNDYGRLRLYVGDADAAYNTDKAEKTAEKCTAALWQLDVDNSYTPEGKTDGDNGGMSYVIRLTDGTFIVVDGGYPTEKEAQNLYSILYSNNVLAGKPQVSAWFITHGHIDHYGALKVFAENYSDKVEVKAFYYNLLGHTIGDIGRTQLIDIEKSMSAWDGAKLYSQIHSGMTFGFAGATVEVLATHEDVNQSYYNGTTLTANSIHGANDSSTVIRVNVGNDKVLFLADTYTGVSNTLYYTHTSGYLKSNMVQVAHHGFNDGATDELYTAIAADVLLWPMDIVRYVNGEIVVGTDDDTSTFLNYCYKDHGQKTAYDLAKDVYPAYRNERLALGNYTVANNKQNVSQSGNAFTGYKYDTSNIVNYYKPFAEAKLAVLGSVPVAGATADTKANNIYYQQNAENSAVRFVAVINIGENELTKSNGFEKLGFKVAMRLDDGKTRITTVDTQTVYTSVMADNITTEASTYGGTYFYALALDGFDTLEGNVIDFCITGFAVYNGQTVEFNSRDISVSLA